MTENEISAIILDASIAVHRELGGPGLLESVYEEALAHELKLRGVTLDRHATQFQFMCQRFFVQVLTYLRLKQLKLGLVINFGAATIKEGFHRVVNGL